MRRVFQTVAKATLETEEFVGLGEIVQQSATFVQSCAVERRNVDCHEYPASFQFVAVALNTRGYSRSGIKRSSSPLDMISSPAS